jgi:D-alanyl-D-alanine carboxypeptidase (penicillin-binding protein 5/6)
MKKTFRKTFIIVFGLAFGLFAGYAVISGVQNISVYTKDFVGEIKFFASENLSQGRPAPEEIFEDREGKDVYFIDYKKGYKISEKAPVPNLAANSYLVGDIETGEIIFSKNENKVLPIASITKLMTAVVADESIGLSKEVRVTESAISTYGEQGKLLEGETYTIDEILYPLLLESSNDAAEVIAESAIRNTFINSMNQKSREVEMYNTHFGDPSGLSPQNISTVSDLFKMLQYIEKYREYIFEITAKKRYELGKKVWFNNSKFRSDDDYYGGKNGYTDIAWKTQVTIFDMDISGEAKKIAFIILKTDDIEGDIYGLKRYVERHVSFE